MPRTAFLFALAVAVAHSAAAQNPSNLWSVSLNWQGDRLVAGAPARITRDSVGGGPSQPSFTPDGKAILYTATRDTSTAARSDIYRLDLASLVETRVTRTPEHENSPTVNAHGEYVAVRWKPETLFRELGVWMYSSDGTPLRALLPAPDTVGYYTELRDGRYVLVQPRALVWTLALFDPATKRTTIIDSAIAAVVREVPGERAISYVKTDSARMPIDIRKYDLAAGRITTLAPVHRGASVHAWAARNTLLMAQGNGLVARRPGRDTAWQRVATFTDPQLRQATVVAATPQGDRIILASPRRASLATVVNDSLDAGRSGSAVAAMVRGLQASGRIADYNATEGVVVGMVGAAVTRRSAADALALAQLGTEMFPTSHRAFASLGDAQRASGDNTAAVASWRKALELNARATDADRTAATVVERKLAGGTPPITAAATQDSVTVRVDRVFDAYARPGMPGCALGVYRDGRMLYSHGYGLANIADATPITPKTIFDIGSTSKQFTATSIILLAQQGKLSLDDDVRRFIPELPRYQKTITIRHLLHHTSGIRDYIGLLTLGGVDISGRATAKQTLDAIVRQKALNFEPGTEHLYSNSGYFLLSQIVERVSGKSMRAFAEENIFRPLGMTSTHYRDDPSTPLPGGATSYSPTSSGFNINLSKWEQTGDGAVNTTVEDLLRWDNNFYDPKVGGPRLLEELHRTGKLDDGTALTYAAGLTVDQFRGLKSVSHGGAWMGFRAELQRFPDQRFSVATLCNVANSNPTALARSVAAIYLADHLAPTPVATPAAPAPRAVVTLTNAELQQWVGNYVSTANGSPRVIVIEGNKLVATVGQTRVELAPHSASEFTVILGANAVLLRFERGPEGRRIRQWIGGQEGPAFDEMTATAPVSPAFAGTYQSDELAASFTIVVADEALQVKLPSGMTATLRRIRDGVFVGGGTTLRFDGPRDGRIAGFELDQGRVRGIRFTRTP